MMIADGCIRLRRDRWILITGSMFQR